MNRLAALPLMFLLAACGAWPDVPAPGAQGGTGAWPALVPLSEVIAAQPEGATGEADATELSARAEALRRRADLLRAPVADGDAFEALRALMAR